jgi:Mrp family chromosome partitioning ATPase
MVNVILIDCGPMRDSSHLLDLAPAIDGVIFVVEAERERREVVARDLESIRRAGLRVFGIVLNKRKRYIPGWLYRAL